MNVAIRTSMVFAVAVVGVVSTLFADAPWSEGFDGPNVSWREAGSDAQYRILRHERVQRDARTGAGCEMLVIDGSMGTFVHIDHPVGNPPVIDELRPSVWVRADRAGLQLAARVVLPRTADPRTGTPVATLVHGGAYTNVGRWQQLAVDGLPQQLTRQVRVLRTELGAAVDSREAFVEAIVLNVYGGPGVTSVHIDDLELSGHVGNPVAKADSLAATAPAVQPSVPALDAADPPGTRVELSGGVLTVEGRPFFPRAVQYRGEPLEQLLRLGFNCIWLETPPSSALLADASRLGLWLICPPPESLRLPPAGGEAAGQFAIGPDYDPVLAWYLGRGLVGADLEPTRQWAERVRGADRSRRRPIVCGAVGDLRGFSRHVDIVLLDRRPIGSSLEMRDYGQWIQRQPRLARPGTPVWTTVQTQPSTALYEQLASLEPGLKPPTAIPHEQIGLIIHTAVGAGSRGLLFLTESDLLGSDQDTQRRTMAMETVNMELALLEPWAAVGTFQAATEASYSELAGTVLRVNHSRVVLPLWLSAGAQYVPDQSATATLSFVVPGVPESANAYELLPGALGTAKHRRVTGGMQVTLDGFGLWSPVVLAQDALLLSQLGSRAGATGPRAAQLYRDLAFDRLQRLTETERQLPASSVPATESALRHREARTHIGRADAHLAASEYRQAAYAARQAMRAMRALERRHWEAVVAMLSSPVTSPGACSFASLPWHWRLGGRIQASQYGRNQLAGGDFEHLQLLLQAGWQHMEHRTEGCRSSVDLVAEASRSGQSGLRLTARPEDESNPPAVIESAPVWIVTSPIQVEAGQLVAIHGYAHVPQPIRGSVDGLMIFDSLSGKALAERIGRTNGWKAFTLFRVAPRSGPLRVTFALTGLGEARIDDVSIRTLQYGASPAAARLPAGHGRR